MTFGFAVGPIPMAYGRWEVGAQVKSDWRLLQPTRFLKARATCHERVLNDTRFSNRMKRRKKHSTNQKKK